MISIKLKSYAKEHGLLTNRDIVYGVIEGYHVSIDQASNEGHVCTLINFYIVNLDDTMKAQIDNFVQVHKDEYKIFGVTYSSNMVSFATRQIAYVTKINLDDKVRGILNLFKENLFISGCAYTNETNNIEFVYANRMIIPASESIILKFVEKSKNQNPNNQDKGYITGTIGALIGGIIGIIPWVVFAMLGYISAISGLAMGWLIKTGYDKGKGKTGGLQFPILVTILVIATYLGIMASQSYFVIQMFMEEGYEISDLRIFEIFKFLATLPFTSQPGSSDMIGEILQGYLFAGLGSIAMFSKLKKKIEYSTDGGIDTNLIQPNTLSAA